MENDVPEVRIFVVCVRNPVFRVKVKFDVAENAFAVDAEFCVEEIRSGEFVPPAAGNDFERFSGAGSERVRAEISAMPDFLENALGKRNGTEKPLYFRNAGRMRE